MADVLARQAGDTSPASLPVGLSRLGVGIVAALTRHKADAEEKKGREEASKGFSRVMAALMAPDGAGTDATASPASLAKGVADPALVEYIRQAAVERGIDPETAIRVASAEGLYANPAEGWQSNITKNGVREPSYGPFQLYMGGGLGNEFQASTGLDPRNPETVNQQIDFALDKAKEGGWTPWYGAKNAGISRWDGINRGGPTSVADSGVTAIPAGGDMPKEQMMAGAKREVEQMPMGQIMELLGNPYLTDAQAGIVQDVVKSKLDRGEWRSLGDGHIFNTATGETMAVGGQTGGGVAAGLQPVYGRDKDGNIVLMQLTKDGQAVQTQLPEGVIADPGLATQERALGKERGEALADLPGAKVAVDYVSTKIDDVLNDPNLQDVTGYASYLPEAFQTNAMIGVKSKLAELSGEAFLQARIMLKGGGAITDFESQKAEKAYSRIEMAVRSSDVRVLKEALGDFKAAVNTGYEKLRARAGKIGKKPAPIVIDGLMIEEAD